MAVQRISVWKNIALYVGLTAAAIVVLFPFFWMVVTAFKEPGQAFSPELFPSGPTLSNFKRVLGDFGFGRYFLNSVIVATTAAAFATLFASLAGYVFAKKQFFTTFAMPMMFRIGKLTRAAAVAPPQTIATDP